MLTLEWFSRFWKTTPHFVRKFVLHTKLPVCFRNLALLGVWDLVITFGAIGPKMVYKTLEPHIQFSQTTPHFVRNFILHTKLLPVYFRNLALWGALSLVNSFRAIVPKMVYKTLPWSHTFNFHKQPLILFEILFRTPSSQFILEIWLYWRPGT